MSGGELLAGGANRILRIGINAAFPLRCWHCESLYTRQETDVHQAENEGAISFDRLMAPFICQACARGYTPVEHPLCEACGRPFQTDHAVDHACPDCFDEPQGFEAARAAGAFDQPLKALIHQYKYQGRAELARPFGMLLWKALLHFYNPLEFDLMIPVPLHWYRRYRRGFNQAALLMRDWYKYAAGDEVPLAPGMITEHALVRRRPTSVQPGLGKAERMVNLKDAFRVPRVADVHGKRILLVDDVLTTGATAVECTKALMRAGAETVKVLTLARAV